MGLVVDELPLVLLDMEFLRQRFELGDQLVCSQSELGSHSFKGVVVVFVEHWGLGFDLDATDVFIVRNVDEIGHYFDRLCVTQPFSLVL